MKCTHCHEKEANTHIKRTINGVTQEMYLCEDCAKELGVMDEFAFEPLSMDNFFGNLLGAGVSQTAIQSLKISSSRALKSCTAEQSISANL